MVRPALEKLAEREQDDRPTRSSARIILAARAREASPRGVAGGDAQDARSATGSTCPASSPTARPRDPSESRAVHRRGRLAPAARPSRAATAHPGDPAAARQGAQRRAGVDRRRCWQQRSCQDIVSALGCGIGDDFDDRQAALRQDLPAHGRRQRRPPHRHAAAHVLLPPPARAHRERRTSTSRQPPLYRIDVGKETLLGARRRGHATRSSRKAPEERQARDHPLQGPRRDAGRGPQGDDPRLRSAAGAAGHRSTNALETDRIINELMGKDASARFRFIMERAAEAKDIDV